MLRKQCAKRKTKKVVIAARETPKNFPETEQSAGVARKFPSVSAAVAPEAAASRSRCEKTVFNKKLRGGEKSEFFSSSASQLSQSHSYSCYCVCLCEARKVREHLGWCWCAAPPEKSIEEQQHHHHTGFHPSTDDDDNAAAANPSVSRISQIRAAVCVSKRFEESPFNMSWC